MIVIAEGVVLFLVIAYFLFSLWKKKKKQVVEFESFLESVKEAEIKRKVLLSETLMDKFTFANDDANESSKQMIEADKKFLQLFLRQQLEQTPVVGVYENLCELLDQYLYFVQSKKGASVEKVSENASGEILENTVSNEDVLSKNDDAKKRGQEENLNGDEGSNDDDEDEEVDWNDAFSESVDDLGEEVENVGLDSSATENEKN